MSSENLSAKASIRIRRSPSEVFDAFADASLMSKFWFSRRDDGLREGAPSTWSLGTGKEAFSFEVLVRELRRPKRIVIEWENAGERTQVRWSMEEGQDGDTILSIEETGFSGSGPITVARVIDSNGGFNQVIVAAKAFIEHGVEVNVVADHV